MKKIICLLGIVILISGCATPIYNYNWVNPNKMQEETQKDIENCKYVSETSPAAGAGFSGGLVGSLWGKKREEFEKCMKMKGYRIQPQEEVKTSK